MGDTTGHGLIFMMDINRFSKEYLADKDRVRFRSELQAMASEVINLSGVVTTQPTVLIKPASPPSLATSPSDTVSKIQPGSILIVTATRTEAQAVLKAFSQAAGVSFQ